MVIDSHTPIVMLTIGQLDQYIEERIQSINVPATPSLPKRYVYGLEGICSLFHCRLNKAQELKKGIIKDAVTQHGRKIMVDVDKALALYEAAKNKE